MPIHMISTKAVAIRAMTAAIRGRDIAADAKLAMTKIAAKANSAVGKAKNGLDA